VLKTVSAKGAPLKDLLDSLAGVNITGDLIIQYAEQDGFHATQSGYKDQVEWLSSSRFSGGTLIQPAKTMITYEIKESYDIPDENNQNDTEYKDADDYTGYLRAYRETGSGQNDGNIGSANSTVLKHMMGVAVSPDGALLSGKDGYTLQTISSKNANLTIRDDEVVSGLVPGMKFAVTAPAVVNAVLAPSEDAKKIIESVTAGTGTVITFKYVEDSYFYVKQNGSTVIDLVYTDFVGNHAQVPEAAEPPYGYEKPMYRRYNGMWLKDLIGQARLNQIGPNDALQVIAKDGSAKTIAKEDIDKYFVAYNHTESKTSTNIPEDKRVTKTYQNAKIIIPEEGEVITGKSSNDYAIEGAPAGVLTEEAAGIVIERSESDAMPPEKVQVTKKAGVWQYNYQSVLTNAQNRASFIEALLDKAPEAPLLILSGNIWYNVNGLTLTQAKEANSVSEPALNYTVVLDDGTVTTPAVGNLIDAIDRSSPLTDPSLIDALYTTYLSVIEHLSAEETALINRNESIGYLLEMYQSNKADESL
jgi:hypothetical protein